MQQAWDVVLHGYGQMLSTIVGLPVAILVVPFIVTASAHTIRDPPTVARLASVIRRSGVRLDAVRMRSVMKSTRRQNAFVIGVWPTRRWGVGWRARGAPRGSPPPPRAARRPSPPRPAPPRGAGDTCDCTTRSNGWP